MLDIDEVSTCRERVKNMFCLKPYAATNGYIHNILGLIQKHKPVKHATTDHLHIPEMLFS